MFEFIYVLKGRFKATESERIFTAGDYIIANKLDHNIYFHTLSEVSLLCVSDNPVFEQQKKKIEILNQLVRSDNYDQLDDLIKLACNIGWELKLKDSQIYQLAFAVALHDNNNQSETILAVLDEADYDKVAEIILQHYERYDGKGRPHGLIGEEIMVESQILAVVDAYWDMIDGRGGIKFSAEEACVQIEAEKNFAFSSRVVDVFLEKEIHFRKRRNFVIEGE